MSGQSKIVLWKKSSHCRSEYAPSKAFQAGSRRTGLTLVEVVVSLVLLASLLVGMITAYSVHHRQARLALQRSEAIEAADQLLATWYRGSESQVPRRGQGVLPGESGFIWRTVPVHRNAIDTLSIEVVRVQIFSSSDAVSLASRGEAAQPLAQVDVLLPLENVR